jgi:ketosteroid isomerase-like protein
MTPIRMQKIESAARIVMAFTEAFNQHDIPAMMQLLSDDCLFEETSPAPDGTTYSGKTAITQYYHDFFTHSPQGHLKIEELLGYGIRCSMRWRYDWVDAAGNPAHLRGLDLLRVQNGLICEKLSYVKR